MKPVQHPGVLTLACACLGLALAGTCFAQADLSTDAAAAAAADTPRVKMLLSRMAEQAPEGYYNTAPCTTAINEAAKKNVITADERRAEYF